jgi:hypothetical protein
MTRDDRSPPGTPPDAVQIDIDWSDEPLPVYANGAQIVHTPREFAIAFTDFAPFSGRRIKPYPTRQGEVAERARVVATIRITPDVFFQLMAAGASNWNKFVDRVGPSTGQAMPKFQVVGAADFQLEGAPEEKER